ncbi:NDP-hexose 2,3-dehydratase family protein [Salinispora fenicalii]|uniref:NDP-hexose 2,3-dehydratase family protein n=1 Tax=Salinispora fenicalii TaxID=1137263 RepID=UPI000488963F|nr:NDP-hexose 2,3-dehydratase family protein [Salinispora fenicalii]
MSLPTLAGPSPLTQRTDARIADRLARSLAPVHGTGTGAVAVLDWLDERRQGSRFRVDRIPFAELQGWSFTPDTGNLVHQSGRFFTVEGLDVQAENVPARHWQQPIISQPEVGILGILAKEFDGVLHVLMQAKMEPGNPNLVQLSPTVQATRSNYTGVHRGQRVRYIEYFTDQGRSRVLADVLQSEHGSWFHHKSNRNMIVETTEAIPEHEDFRWLTLGQVTELLHHDNVVNMDARTVLSCLPWDTDDGGRALHSDADLRSWFTAERARHDVRARLIPLDEVRQWRRGDWTLDQVEGRYFRVVAVAVQAANREVPAWTQPLFEPVGPGVIAFLHRRIGGVPHLLVRATVEAGFLDTVELGPTVQCVPASHDTPPPFLDAVLGAPPERIRFETVHAEEGGRFLNAVSRYLIVDVDDTNTLSDLPPGYRWVTAGQLTTLVRHGHYLNVQARSLLACFRAMSNVAS